MDIIFIEALKVDTIIGIYDWEKQFKQPLYFDIEVQADTRISAQTDDIHKTVNYKALSDDIIAFVEATKYELLETLAEDICQLILKSYDSVKSMTLTVKKPQAIPQAKSAGIRIIRSR